MNLIVLAGRVAAEPEIRTFESEATLVKLLISVRQEEPRPRIDVIPVVMWNPDLDKVATWTRGERLWVAGSVQRRFWSTDREGRQSRVEIVAHEITLMKEAVTTE